MEARSTLQKLESHHTYFRDEVTGAKYYRCEVCSKKLKGHVSIHMRTHSGAKPWRCKLCSKTFAQKCNLQSHLALLHKGHQIKEEEGHDGGVNKVKHDNLRKRFKCELCPKGFDYKKNLERHTRVHTREKPYQCSYCKLWFATDCMLVKHLRVHTGETPYECLFCGKRLAQYVQFVYHLRRHHLREKSYICRDNQCLREFYGFKEFRVHTLQKHERHKMLKCIFCPKRLLTRKELEDHLWTHTKEMEVCFKCGEEFPSRYLYRKHVFQNHPEAFRGGTMLKGIKRDFPYKCDLCSENNGKNGWFPTSTDLIAHYASVHHIKDSSTMKKYHCDKCDAKFFIRSHLTGHLRFHRSKKGAKV